MATLIIDFKEIESFEDFYQQLGEKTILPAYFGHNLDALWDFVTVDLAMPAQIIFENFTEQKQEAYGVLLGLLEEAANEMPEDLAVQAFAKSYLSEDFSAN